MKTIHFSTATAAALAALTFSASAGSYDPPVVDAPYIPPAPAAHDWGGAYAGLSYAVDLNGNLGANLAAARLGYNWDNGNMVYGGELVFGVATPGTSNSFADIGARLGVKAGDNLLLIGKIGYGYIPVTAVNYISVQIGGEYAINDRFSVTGAYESWIDPLAVFPATSQAVFGFNYGF